MSRSPLKPTTDADANDYWEASVALNELVRRGSGFSGHERHCVFLNTGGPRFADVSAVSGLDFDDDGRAMAATDWDFDGDIDLWLANRTAPRVRFMRNRGVPGLHFAAFRLRGTTSNRDAIGARVELKLADATLGRTVYAGDAFLSQSSKWVHFGLGQADRIEQVTVRWPGAQPQTFKDINVDQHYLLVQGQAPQLWTPPAVESPTPRPAQVTEPTDRARVVLSVPVPMPPLAGLADSEGPVLLNLWATWCQPCVKELTQWTEQQQRIRDAELTIVAASVDGIGDAATTTQQDAARLLKSIQFPFPSRAADPALLDRLEILCASQFLDRHPFPVPTSLLITPDRKLAAIYFGPVDLDQMLADVHTDAARPTGGAGGRWYTQAPTVSPHLIATDFLDAGYVDDAAHLLSRQAAPGVPEPPGADQWKLYANIGIAYAKQQRWEPAAHHLRRATELAPDVAATQAQLADVETRLDRLDAAIVHYEKALALRPNWPTAQYALAWLIATHEVGNPARAIELAEAVVATTARKQPRALNALAAAYARAGRFDDAVAVADEAISLHPPPPLLAEITRRRDAYAGGETILQD